MSPDLGRICGWCENAECRKSVTASDRRAQRCPFCGQQIRGYDAWQEDAAVAASTPSAFSDWVFHKTSGRKRQLPHCVLEEDSESLRDLEAGRQCEFSLELLFREARLTIRDPRLSHWKLRYRDSHHDPGSEASEVLFASQLRLGSQTFRCRPDLVFEHSASGAVVIVERKCTKSTNIPDDGWPSNRAQIWCYSWIDDWAAIREEKVLLVLQFYRARGDAVPILAKQYHLRPCDLDAEAESLYAEYIADHGCL